MITGKEFDLTSLDAIIRDFAGALFEVYPDWRAAAAVQRSERTGNFYFVVEVPPPAASRITGSLRIMAENDEVTIFLDHYHDHFFLEPQDGFGADAMEFIGNLLAERCWVVSWWSGETCTGSGLMTTEQKARRFFGATSTATQARVRSWNGTYSCDHDRP
jgi:hypothetical protein